MTDRKLLEKKILERKILERKKVIEDFMEYQNKIQIEQVKQKEMEEIKKSEKRENNLMYQEEQDMIFLLFCEKYNIKKVNWHIQYFFDCWNMIDEPDKQLANYLIENKYLNKKK